jgi:hypothetical protein
MKLIMLMSAKTKNLNDKVILGLPFIHLLLPFTTDVDGITTAPFGQPVKFNFLNRIEENDAKMLKDNLISQSICLIKNKEKHLKFLKEEVQYQRVEQQLTCKILQQRIERFQEKLNQEVCSNFPKAFWDEKLTLLNSLMLKILMKETSLLKPDLSK